MNDVLPGDDHRNSPRPSAAVAVGLEAQDLDGGADTHLVPMVESLAHRRRFGGFCRSLYYIPFYRTQSPRKLSRLCRWNDNLRCHHIAVLILQGPPRSTDAADGDDRYERIRPFPHAHPPHYGHRCLAHPGYMTPEVQLDSHVGARGYSDHRCHQHSQRLRFPNFLQDQAHQN